MPYIKAAAAAVATAWPLCCGASCHIGSLRGLVLLCVRGVIVLLCEIDHAAHQRGPRSNGALNGLSLPRPAPSTADFG